MAVFNNMLAGAAGSGGAAGADNFSLRFNSADSAYLSRTFGSGGNRKKWTWAGWVKFTGLPAQAGQTNIFGAYGSGTATTYHRLFIYEDKLYFSNGSNDFTTRQVFRDYSAWYHIVLAFDTTQTDAADREIFYINGVRVDTVADSTLSFDTEYGINNASLHNLGRINLPTPRYSNIYLADVHFLDGIAPGTTTRVVNGVTETILTDFGAFDNNGVWNPKAYTGTYPGNSFHLDFADNSSKDALGYDAAGSNNWDVNNITASYTNYSNTATETSTSGYTPSSNPNYYLPNLFDGNTGTYYTIAVSGTNNVTATFSPKLPSGTTIEIFGWKNSTNTTGVVEVNGTDVSSSIDDNYPGSWADVSSAASGGIQTITLYRIDGVKNPALTGIRVDGTVLVDVNPADIDSLRDSPTNGDTADDTGAGGEVPGNYATLNPLAESGGNRINAVNGNLDADGLSYGYWGNILSTIAVSSGKWYAEFTVATAGLGVAVGILDVNPLPSTYSNDDQYMGRFAKGYGYRSDSGNKVNNNSATSYGATFTNGDVIGVALDLDAGTLVFYKNNTSQGTAFSSLSGTFAFAVATVDSVSLVNCNFGQRAFAYSAPSGYKALCTANLDDPTIADGSTAMDVALYTGNGSTNTITGLGFSPDFVWIKPRSAAYDHIAFDTVRGTLKALFPNLNNAENSNFTGTLTAFNSDGYTIGSQAQINQSGVTFASWCWDAGSSTVSNTDGSVTSSVRANANAGFSIVTYTGGSGEISVGHGLGVAPSFIICRPINNSSPWATYHSSIGKDGGLNFSTSAAFSISNYWGTSGVTSTIFGAQNGNINNNGSSYNHVAYCFAPVEGYSAFGSYTGNGSSTSPPFVYTGFRVKWLMLKCTSTGGSNWILHDVARKGYNAQGPRLFPNLSDAESTPAYDMVDLYSNGFSPIRTVLDYNQNGDTYIYAAFAEHPQKYARAR